jgi:hypothetical protein
MSSYKIVTWLYICVFLLSCIGCIASSPIVINKIAEYGLPKTFAIFYLILQCICCLLCGVINLQLRHNIIKTFLLCLIWIVLLIVYFSGFPFLFYLGIYIAGGLGILFLYFILLLGINLITFYCIFPILNKRRLILTSFIISFCYFGLCLFWFVLQNWSIYSFPFFFSMVILINSVVAYVGFYKQHSLSSKNE